MAPLLRERSLMMSANEGRFTTLNRPSAAEEANVLSRTRPACARNFRGGRSPAARPPDFVDEPNAVYEGERVACESNRAEDGDAHDDGTALDSHDDRRTYHERCGHDPDRYTIERRVDLLTEIVEALEIEIDARLAAARLAEQAGNVPRDAADDGEKLGRGAPASAPQAHRGEA